MTALIGSIARALEAEQDRWFLWIPVLLAAGIAIYFAVPVEPAATMAAFVLTMVVLLRLWWRDSLLAYLTFTALAVVCAGVAIATLRTLLVAAPVLDHSLSAARLAGWVELIEPREAGGRRVSIRVTSIDGLAADRTPRRVRVHSRTIDPTLQPGDHVSLRARLSPPPEPAMPGAYDFARQAWFERLGAVGFALAPPERAQAPTAAPADLRLRAAVNRLRAAISRRIMAAIPGERGAIADALITGERGAITERTNAAFRDSGLFHVLSISGLHMTIMAGAVFVAVRFLLSLIPALALRAPIKKWAAVAATLGALAYLSISGGSLPTVRSFVMIQIMFVAILLDRPALALRNVALAALLILLVTPESIIDVSFQMSFAAVVALVSAYEAIRDRRRAEPRATSGRRMLFGPLLLLGGIVASTLIASAAVAPLGAYHFHKSQQYAALANLIAIPIVNLVIMPLALASLVALPFGLERWPLEGMALGIDGMVWCAYAVAGLPGSVFRIPAMPQAAFLLMVAGGLWAALWRTRMRHAGWIAVLAGLAVAPWGPRPDVIVSRDGNLVAARRVDGTLAARSERGATFELSRWLERDGDPRAPAAVLAVGTFACDHDGCATPTAGGIVAVARHPAALRDDCARAAVVVTRLAASRHCTPQLALIDRARLARNGAHAITLTRDGARILTNRSWRGARPWVLDAPASAATRAPPPVPRTTRTPQARPKPAHPPRSRTGDFAWREIADDPPTPEGNTEEVDEDPDQ